MNEMTDTTHPLRILIADDVQETRRSLQLIMDLVPDTQVVALAQDGRQAVELARQQRPEVAFMDVNMPEMDGLTAIEIMMQEQPDLVCIVISAEKQSQTLQRALQVGAKGYLIKPFTTQQVVEIIERSQQWLLTRPKLQRAQVEPPITTPDHAQVSDPIPGSPPPPDPRERFKQLEQQAFEYAKAHRTDDEACELFETLAAQPDCPERWLQVLAMIYTVRKDWMKLRALATHLEKTSR